MIGTVLGLVVLGAEGHPPEAWYTQLSVPLMILVFFGSTYLLVRANLGTKRGYLVMATCFFGLMILLSLWWAFGGWGTPQAVGPSQLPGQPIDELEPRWIPFAEDSRIGQEEYPDLVEQFPDGFETVEDVEAVPDAIEDEERLERVEDGVEEIRSYFAQDDVEGVSVGLVTDIDEPQLIGWTTAPDDTLVMGVEYERLDEDTLEPTDEEPFLAFGYFEEGAVFLPGMTIFTIALVLFVLHAWLLDRDERMERRARQEELERQEPERVPAGA